MLSPVKAITAGALVFALGGVLLIAQPFDQQGASVPGAATEVAEPVEFSSRLWNSGQPTIGQKETFEDGSFRYTGQTWIFSFGETSDDRFDGTMTFTYTVDVRPSGAVQVGAARVENQGGAWQEMPTYDLHRGLTRSVGDTVDRVFVGEDGYEGWVAVAVDTWWPDGESGGTAIKLDGYIFEGALPSNPEPWSAE